MITTKGRAAIKVLTTVLLAIGLAACGGSNSVGSGVNLHGSGGAGNLSLGSTTSTTAITPTSAPPTTTSPARAVTTTSPPTTAARTVTTVASVYVIHINGDTSGQPAFAPTDVAVYQGTSVEWINSDSKPHSVVATDGAFTSPSIPPGGSWTWVANTAGRHDYADGTRPYATGTLEVAAR